MTDVVKLVDTIKRMTTEPGDIIHIKLNPLATPKQAMEVATDIGNFAVHREVYIIVGDVAENISRVTEKQMNKLGWYRK